MNYIRYKAFKKDLLGLSLIFFSAIVFLHKGIFFLAGPQVLSSRYTDTYGYFFPILSFGFGLLLKGSIPLWNPYIYGGTPFVATLQTGIFYPLNCLHLILPTSRAINWTIFLHLFLSGAFMYYLLKDYGRGRLGSVIAGLVYAFSAPQIMHIFAGHLNAIAAMTWTPLMLDVPLPVASV